MMRKYLVMLAAACTLALAASVLGVLVTVVRTSLDAPEASDSEAWRVAATAQRSEEEALAAVAGFTTGYRWLPVEAPPEEAPQVDQATAVVAEVPAAPPWRFVGVLQEQNDTGRFALVTEAGRVNKYKVGDAFVDGTTLLAIEEQSLRVSDAGQERDVFLYRRN